MRRLGLVATAVVICACSGSAPPTARPTDALDPGYVTRAEYGADWPFMFPAGTLRCYDGAAAGGDGRILVTIDAGEGIEYGLNGSALDFGWPDLDAGVMPDYPDKSNLGDLIDRGLSLC